MARLHVSNSSTVSPVYSLVSFLLYEFDLCAWAIVTFFKLLVDSCLWNTIFPSSGSVKLQVSLSLKGNTIFCFLKQFLDVTVPFEEDDRDSSIWFLDHNYHESMFSMFRRINGMSIANSVSIISISGFF